MADREKVIKGFKICDNNEDGIVCKNCPYKEDKWNGAWEDETGNTCFQTLHADVLELLKEQEAVEPKQIVRKQCKTEHSDGSVDYYAEWFCPHCNSLLKRGFDASWIEYCFKCGKPITWEGR